MLKLNKTIMGAGKGNALQACVASFFGCDNVDDVPNFVTDPGKTYLQSINTGIRCGFIAAGRSILGGSDSHSDNF